ncbi:MAG: hypothetical protein JWP97_649 [Labilithrix sp.]|nr:hypothetical protein [Labilithrix sp.]
MIGHEAFGSVAEPRLSEVGTRRRCTYAMWPEQGTPSPTSHRTSETAMERADLSFTAKPTSDGARVPLPDASHLDGEAVMNAILARGKKFLSLVWLSYGPTVISVEDDAMFLVDSWKESIELAAGTREEHLTFLGDGQIDVVAARSGPDTVTLVCKYVPHLRRGLLRTENVSMTIARYESAWRSLMQDLLAITDVREIA